MRDQHYDNHPSLRQHPRRNLAKANAIKCSIGSALRNRQMVYLGQTEPDFDGPFYNEHYYSRNFSSSSSSTNKKTFKTPEPHDQRWYSYNCPTGMYTALSKS
ncbi:hypothetical protein ACFX2B_027739 [Malus domestica]